MRSDWSLLFSKLHKAQLAQPFFTGELLSLQLFHHLCGSPLDPLEQPHALLVLGAPRWDTVLQKGPYKGRVEGDNSSLMPPILWCSSGCHWPSGLQKHTADSRPAFCLSGPPNPFWSGMLSMSYSLSLYSYPGLPQSMQVGHCALSPVIPH